MRMARLHIEGARVAYVPTSITGMADDAKLGTVMRLNGGNAVVEIEETFDEAEAEINAALRDIEGAEQRTRLDELLSDCLRKEAADDTA